MLRPPREVKKGDRTAMGGDACRMGFPRYVHRAKSEAPESQSSFPPDFDFLGLFRPS